MNSQVEKVYVSLGNDLRDGLKTLEWTLWRWKPEPISIVILHVTRNISKDVVYTPFGKLPASAVSDEKLEVLKKHEQQKIDTLLSEYIAFCGKAKAEIMKVEASDEPFHKALVELITRHKVTKLVMGLGISFTKCSSRKSRDLIRGLFYIQEHKPEFCEFFLICGGKLIILGGENDQEGIIEDDQGVIVSKKSNFKCRFGKSSILQVNVLSYRQLILSSQPKQNNSMDVMKDPHVAAEGFSYELQGIEEWLRMGKDASPKTQLRLKHKFLTPNHSLRDLIRDWQIKKFAVSS